MDINTHNLSHSHTISHTSQGSREKSTVISSFGSCQVRLTGREMERERHQSHVAPDGMAFLQRQDKPCSPESELLEAQMIWLIDRWSVVVSRLQLSRLCRERQQRSAAELQYIAIVAWFRWGERDREGVCVWPKSQDTAAVLLHIMNTRYHGKTCEAITRQDQFDL